MKILHVSNFVQKHNGRLYWNMAFKINNGLTRLGHNVLSFSDRDIARENFLKSSRLGSNDANKKLLLTCSNYKPDLIILGHADIILNSTLEKISVDHPDCKIIMWNVDHLLMNNTLNKIQNRSKYVSNTFITTGDKMISKSALNGMQIHFIPNIFDKSIDDLTIFNNKKFQYDIFFAMSHGVGSGVLKKGKTDGREKVLSDISKNNRINENFYGFNNIEPIWGNDFKVQINKSMMGLNLSSGKCMHLYSSDRISSYIGNGLLTFIDSKYNFHELYNDKEVVFYKDNEELIEKIIYFKSNPEIAKNISKNGWIVSHDKYDTIKVCNFMINKTFKNIIQNHYWTDITY